MPRPACFGPPGSSAAIRREREVVVLRYYTDQSEAMVADLLGVGVGTVKSTASRGIVRLRELLTSEGEVHA